MGTGGGNGEVGALFLNTVWDAWCPLGLVLEIQPEFSSERGTVYGSRNKGHVSSHTDTP